MARDPSLSAINCTSCGAGLDLLGGGRVMVHVCPYCGTMLDAHAGYKALRQFKDMPRPDSPLRIGMSATLRGAEYTIIGTIGLRERYGGETWTWVDHQLYSPTHGYAWITLEMGHFIWTRRLRDLVWMSSATVERAEYRPTIWVGHDRYCYFETSNSEVTFAEGEFTWAPSVGERSTTVSVLSDTAMVSFTQTKTEREVERSVYLRREEVEQAFGVTDLPAAQGSHPLTPLIQGKNFDFLRITPLALAVVCVVLGVLIGGLPGSRSLPATSVLARDLPVDIPFEIADVGRLSRITIEGDVRNSWAWVEIEVTDPDDMPVFAAGRGLEYYFGNDGGESWIENNRTGTVSFRPEKAGTHTLSLEISETGIWGPTQGDKAPVSNLSVSVYSGKSNGAWLYRLSFVFAIIAAVPWFISYFQHQRRWAKSDWTDEE